MALDPRESTRSQTFSTCLDLPMRETCLEGESAADSTRTQCLGTHDIDEVTHTIFRIPSEVVTGLLFLSGAYGGRLIAYCSAVFLVLLTFHLILFFPVFLLLLHTTFRQHIENLCCGDTRGGNYRLLLWSYNKSI